MQDTCRICGKPLEKGDVSYCNSCSEILLYRVYKMKTRKKHNGLKECIVCGKDILHRGRRAVTCSDVCWRIYNSFSNRYNRLKRKGIVPKKVKDARIEFKKDTYTEEDKKMAEKLGMKVQNYVKIKRKRTKLDDYALEARLSGMTYGEWMLKHGKYNKILQNKKPTINTALVQMI